MIGSPLVGLLGLSDQRGKSWAVGKVMGVLGISLVLWFGAHLWPINTSGSLLIIVTFLAAVLWKLRQKVGFDWFSLVEEFLFLAGFSGLSLVRGFKPEILDLEKFMDYGFVNSYLRTDKLPAMDMWFANETINYYSFGHFVTSVLVRLLGVSPGVGYNLVLGVMCGLTLSLSFSVIINLISKTKNGVGWQMAGFGALVGSLLVTIGGNSHWLWYFLKNHSMDGYWYPDATRFIFHTIHEFPGYSFVVSDLHGHVLDLPFVLLFLFVLTTWLKKRTRILEGLLGVILGVMAMTNTWDALVYGLLLAIVIVGVLVKGDMVRELLKTGLVTLFFLVVTALPWYLNFRSISDGVGMVTERTPLWQLGVLWGGHLILGLLAIVVVGRKRAKNWMVIAVVMTGMILLFIPEVIYVKDIYTTYPRANTMFKLTYQAFILLSVAGGWLLASLQKKMMLAYPFVLMLIVLLCGYATLSFPNYFGKFTSYQGLDGEKWLRRDNPDRMAVIDYLRSKKETGSIVEAVGDSYTKYDVISAYTGRPTILGWKVHEWLWRGGYETVGARAAEVTQIYQAGDVASAKKILRKYSVGWIVVGEEEQKTYQVDEQKLRSLGKIEQIAKNVYVVEVGM